MQQWAADIEGALSESDKTLVQLQQVKEKLNKKKQAVELAETMKQEMALESENAKCIKNVSYTSRN